MGVANFHRSWGSRWYITLGGGNSNIWLMFTPIWLGKISQFDDFAYFSKWVVSTTNYSRTAAPWGPPCGDVCYRGSRDWYASTWFFGFLVPGWAVLEVEVEAWATRVAQVHQEMLWINSDQKIYIYIYLHVYEIAMKLPIFGGSKNACMNGTFQLFSL